MKDLVSIIIVNYNTETLLENCMKSIIEKTTGIAYEIIVIDNNSEAGSLSPLMEKYPSVLFHILNENVGFGRANNIGAEIANGEYLLILNPDTVLVNDAVSILYKHMKNNPKTGVCGGNLYREDMSPAVSYFDITFHKREYLILLNRKWRFGFNSSGKDQETLAVMGADFFISKALFLSLGGFDPDFFMYYEEIYLCDKVRETGYKIMSIPEARIIHLEGGAGENKTEELNKWSYQERWYSKFIYFSKTKGRFETKMLYLANMMKLKSALIAHSMKGNKPKIEYWKTKEDVLNKTYKRYKEYLQKQKIGT